MIDFTDAIDFRSYARKATFFPDVEQRAIRLTRDYGVTAMSAFCVSAAGGQSGLGQVFAKTDGEWVSRYRAQNLASMDVTIPILMTAENPFYWSGVRTRCRSDGEERIFDMAAEHGMGEGFLVPVSMRHGTKGSTIMTGPAICGSPEAEAFLEMIARSVFEAARRLSTQDHSDVHTPLSDRERQCLHLSSQNKTDRDIATQIDISHKTVNRYVESAKKKLGATNRQTALRVAIERGEDYY